MTSATPFLPWPEVGSLQEVRLPYALGPRQVWLRPASQPSLPSPPPGSVLPWASLLPAYQGLAVLARCRKNNSWLRARVLTTDVDHVRVFFMDCGREEDVQDPARLADLPTNLRATPEVLCCCLELPDSPWHSSWRIKLLRLVRSPGLRWRALVLRQEEQGGVLARLWYLVPGEEEWRRLAPGEEVSPSPPAMDCTGQRLGVRVVDHQPFLSPSCLLLELQDPGLPYPRDLQTSLANSLGPTSGPSALLPGHLVAVCRNRRWDRAQILELGQDGVRVKLLDLAEEVEVRYSDCRDLPETLVVLPPLRVTVALQGVEERPDWGGEEREEMCRVLHLGQGGPTPVLAVVVHCCTDPLRWRVSLLEVVGGNHQVDVGALLVQEGLARALGGRGRVVLGLWEGKTGNVGPWNKETEKKENMGRGGERGEVQKKFESKISDANQKVDHEQKDHTKVILHKKTEPNKRLAAIFPIEGDVNNQNEAVRRSRRSGKCEVLPQEDRAWRLEGSKRTSNNICFDMPPSSFGVKRKVSQWLELAWPQYLGRKGQAVLTNLESSGVVWLVPGSSRRHQEELQRLLLEVQHQPLAGRPLEVGEAVLALWPEDDSWHRATVLELQGEGHCRVLVHFVDWGNTEVMERKELVDVAEVERGQDLLLVPGLVVQTVLQGVRLDRGRGKEVLELMARVQGEIEDSGSSVQYTVCGVGKQGEPLVELSWVERGGRRSLADLLLGEGLATRVV